MNDKSAEPGDRIRAAELMFNRVLGKPREVVSVDFQGEDAPPWKRMMAKAIVATAEQAGALLIEEEEAKIEKRKTKKEQLDDNHRRRARGGRGSLGYRDRYSCPSSPQLTGLRTLGTDAEGTQTPSSPPGIPR